MVKAIRIHEFGGTEVLKWEDVEVGDPGPGQLRLRHTVVGFNFLDIVMRAGRYPVLPDLPGVLGNEAAGIVEAVGAGVTGFSEGDRVAYAATVPGSYVEARLVDATQAVALPDAISDEDAAAGLLKGMTGHYLTQRCYPIKPGEVALVHAAAGGVGLMLCQWLRYAGASVIATAGSEEKMALAKQYGADHAINYRDGDFAPAVRELTDGTGVHVVYDSVGPAVWQSSIDSLAPLGYMVNYGNASGPLAPIDAGELNVKGSLFFTKASMRFYQLNRQELEDSATALFDAMAAGAVKPVIGQRYALSDAATAHTDVWERRTTGSTVYTLE